MFDIFYWSIGWIPAVLRIPIQIVCVILAVVIAIKLIQAIMSIISAVIGFFL